MTYTPPTAANGPQSDADLVLALVATRDAAAQELAQETAAITSTGGARPTYSMGGRSLSWNDWRSAMLKHITDLNALIQSLDPPWEIRVRGW